METVTVELSERSYPIAIGAGVLDGLGERVRALRCGRRAAVVTNPAVASLYGASVVDSLESASFEPTLIEIPDGEEHKNLAWFGFLHDHMLQAGLDRESPVIALGGGVVGDLAGFSAATLLRGVPFVQVPTTLLAQVDSSVGGKTGVNHANGKNLIGTFYQPHLVWIDVHTLRSLPERQVRAGMAEVIKYAVILSPGLFERLEEGIECVMRLDDDVLVDVVRLCCELKAKVVSEDEREAGLRSILNFGHTVGHAVEVLTDYREYLHGEAIAIGMVFASRLSAAKGHCAGKTAARITALIRRAGLPTEIPDGLDGEVLAAAIKADKKVSSGKIKFVAVAEIGRTRFDHLTCEEIVADAGY